MARLVVNRMPRKKGVLWSVSCQEAVATEILGEDVRVEV